MTVCRNLLAVGDCIEPHHEIVKLMVQLFERSAPLDVEHVNLRMIEAENEILRVENFLAEGSCDVVIVIGTTAIFGYIIDWSVRAGGEKGQLIEINPAKTALSRFARRTIREPAAVALPRLLRELMT